MKKLKLWNNYLDNWIKVNWIKADRVLCSTIKELFVEVINLMCNVQYYDTLIGFIGHYLKRHDLNIDSGSIYKYNGSSPYKLKEYSDD